MTDQLERIRASFENFPAASAEACANLRKSFRSFALDQYVALLLQTNGLGEVFAEGDQRFVHNMLIVSLEEAIEESERAFRGGVLVIGRPGVDGILFVLKPTDPSVYAYYPVDSEFLKLAPSLEDFLLAYTLGTVRL